MVDGSNSTKVTVVGSSGQEPEMSMKVQKTIGKNSPMWPASA